MLYEDFNSDSGMSIAYASVYVLCKLSTGTLGSVMERNRYKTMWALLVLGSKLWHVWAPNETRIRILARVLAAGGMCMHEYLDPSMWALLELSSGCWHEHRAHVGMCVCVCVCVCVCGVCVCVYVCSAGPLILTSIVMSLPTLGISQIHGENSCLCPYIRSSS